MAKTSRHGCLRSQGTITRFLFSNAIAELMAFPSSYLAPPRMLDEAWYQMKPDLMLSKKLRPSVGTMEPSSN